MAVLDVEAQGLTGGGGRCRKFKEEVVKVCWSNCMGLNQGGYDLS